MDGEHDQELPEPVAPEPVTSKSPEPLPTESISPEPVPSEPPSEPTKAAPELEPVQTSALSVQPEPFLVSEEPEPPRKKHWGLRIVAVLFFFALPAPVLLLLIFRFVPIPGTPEMLFSLLTGHGAHYSWRGADEISPLLGREVIASEDQNFCTHNGFDWKSINAAVKAHERHPARRMRGASTISQQAARSLFLLPVRSWVRKGTEAYLTVLMEALWPKKRILTAYLNLVDWGHGNFGAEAASQAYFRRPASALNGAEAARLAAILPDPDVWKAAHPGPYVARRAHTLVARGGEVVRDGLDFCVRNQH